MLKKLISFIKAKPIVIINGLCIRNYSNQYFIKLKSFSNLREAIVYAEFLHLIEVYNTQYKKTYKEWKQKDKLFKKYYGI